MIVKIHIAIELLEKGRMLTKEIHKCIYGWAILAQNMPLGTLSIMEGEKNNWATDSLAGPVKYAN